MPASLTIITPHCDRPEALSLCERWVGRQSRKPDQWILVDDGHIAAEPSAGQDHVRRPAGDPGFLSLCRNLLAALPLVKGEIVAVIENDDWYAPGHLSDLADRLERVALAGSIWQPYYNLPTKRWHVFRNIGASLCQTGFRRELLPLFRQAIETCIEKQTYGVDGTFWRVCRARDVHEDNPEIRTSIGIKGLPGRAGLGVGHRPDKRWDLDENGDVLREWVGADADVYWPYWGTCTPGAT